MMGLLGDITDDPATMGLLSLGFGLMGARGNIGQGLGQAGPMALDAMRQAKVDQQRKAMFDQQQAAAQQAAQMYSLQMQQMQRQAEEQQRAQAFLQGLQSPQMQAAGGALAVGGGPTVGNAARMPAVDPMQQMMFGAVKAGALPLPAYLASMQKDETPIVAPEGSTVLTRTGKIIGSGGRKEDDFVRNMRAAGIVEGSPQWVQLLIQKAQKDATHAPPVNVSVSMDKGFGEAFAKDAAASLATSRDQARAAASNIQTLDRIGSVLDSGKVALGPTAKFETFGRQLGETIGLGGKDNAEKLGNTRKLIQGAATLAADGAKLLAGQGQITEAERGLIARASGGDIDSMTAPEIRALAGVLRKVNAAKIAGHQAQLKNVDPKFAPFVPFYNVDSPAEPTSVDDLLKKYGAK